MQKPSINIFRDRKVVGRENFLPLENYFPLLDNEPAPATIFPPQKLHLDTHGRQLERWRVRVLAPTLKKVLPFGGIDRLQWEALLQQKHTSAADRALTALLHHIINDRGRGYTTEHGLALATQVVGHIRHKLFQPFFFQCPDPC